MLYKNTEDCQNLAWTSCRLLFFSIVKCRLYRLSIKQRDMAQHHCVVGALNRELGSRRRPPNPKMNPMVWRERPERNLGGELVMMDRQL